MHFYNTIKRIIRWSDAFLENRSRLIIVGSIQRLAYVRCGGDALLTGVTKLVISRNEHEVPCHYDRLL